MFQIFAARMFEQRVLTAYREKVANDRQQKLLEELEEEDRNETQLQAKKAREAAKKKEKKQKQKQAKDEEKAKKEAEKAAHEAALREAEEKKVEEQRQRKEEQRKKREAEKKAADEERLRKEAEKQKRLQDERERHQEVERRHREAKEREKKKREDARRKEREEREAKEREAKEAREKTLKDDQERKATEDQEREKEAAERAEKEARSQHAELPRRPLRRPIVAVPTPKVPPIANHGMIQSPQFQVATPAVPAKVPTPGRPRQPSRQGPQSHGSSPQSAHATTTDTALSSTPSSSSFTMSSNPGAAAPKAPAHASGHAPALQHPQPSVPISPLSSQRSNQPAGSYHLPGQPTIESSFGMMPGMHSQIPPMPHLPQGPAFPAASGQYRGFGAPNGPSFPPGMGNRQGFPQGLGHPFQPSSNSSGISPSSQTQGDRKLSGGQIHAMPPPHDQREIGAELNPMSRLAPIGQSSHSTPERKENKSAESDVDKVTQQLGSKALLEGSEQAPALPISKPAPNMLPPGPPGSGRGPGSKFGDPRFDAFHSKNWPNFAHNSAYSAQANWGPGQPPQADGWPPAFQPNAHAFGFPPTNLNPSNHAHHSRPVAIRLMLVDGYRALLGPDLGKTEGWIPAKHLLNLVQGMQVKSPDEPRISMGEMLDICDTEGSAVNGGGVFHQRSHQYQQFDGPLLRFVPVADGPASAPGVIAGSPVLGSPPATFGGIGQPVTGPR